MLIYLCIIWDIFTLYRQSWVVPTGRDPMSSSSLKCPLFGLYKKSLLMLTLYYQASTFPFYPSFTKFHHVSICITAGNHQFFPPLNMVILRSKMNETLAWITPSLPWSHFFKGVFIEYPTLIRILLLFSQSLFPSLHLL